MAREGEAVGAWSHPSWQSENRGISFHLYIRSRESGRGRKEGEGKNERGRENDGGGKGGGGGKGREEGKERTS